MCKNILNIFAILVGIVIWIGSLLIQHIACFDVFDSNFAYLYLLASLFSIIQYVSLLYIGKHLKGRIFLFLSCILYLILSICEIKLIFISKEFPMNSIGLVWLALILDLIGIGASIWGRQGK